MTREGNGPSSPQGEFGKIGDTLRDAGDKAGAMADDAKNAGVDQIRQVAETAERVADDLQQQSPLLADYVRDAAHRIESMGEALRERTVGDMLSVATEYGRKQPILFFAGAAVLGFALSRFVRSGLSPSSAATSSAAMVQREAVSKATGIDV